MPRDSRMSRMLHVLIHMDRHMERATSEQIAKMLETNPVVVRRMMSGLRKAGIVTAERGQSGGWQLEKELSEISLLDVHEALGAPSLFNIGMGCEKPECLVEQAVEAKMQKTITDAEKRLKAQFSNIFIEDVAQDFEHRMALKQKLKHDEACNK